MDKFINAPSKMRTYNKVSLPSMNKEYIIEFKNVSFRYSGQSNYTLKNINLMIKNGEKISIVGENGAGKTTFVKLITRLYDPTEGVILLNGIDIKTINYDEYQSLLSAVFQDFKLFSFTLKENITFSCANNIKDELVENYLIQSGFKDKLLKLDKGVNTSVYKNFDLDGFEPSGGEGQKIALARALYKDAPIVILDEPTAALDPRAEYEIYTRFNELVRGKTAIYISHRLASSKFCDKIIVFKDGEIYENGTHDELISQNGLYKELFIMQAQFYI